MSKTHAEFLEGCPHCGKPPKVDEKNSYDFDIGESEKIIEIYCSDPDCAGGYNSIEQWNNRANKHAEFLEELKNELKMEIREWRKYPMTFAQRIQDNELVIDKIEQFESELKRAEDDTTRA